jgi:hypothetical protein
MSRRSSATLCRAVEFRAFLNLIDKSVPADLAVARDL